MNHNTKNPLAVLIDGSSYLYRAFHALPPLTNASGEPTGAILGVLNMLKRLQESYQADYIAVVFDPKGLTHRHQLYSAYKATRPAMPDDLVAQIAPLHDMIRAMGLPLLLVEGIEADDVIGTLAKQAERQGIDVIISTGDKDFAQLVSEHITLVNTMTNSRLDRDGVQEKFGITPEQIIDYLALIGDSVDNIPGVPKVGPKTAKKWLNHYGTLEELITHADEIKGKVGENLRDHLEALTLSKQLVTIDQSIELPISLEECQATPEDEVTLLVWLKRFEFKSWVTVRQNNQPKSKLTVQIVTTQKQLTNLAHVLANEAVIAFDIKTTNTDAMQAQLVGLSFSTSDQIFYVPVAHVGGEQLPLTAVLLALTPIFSDAQKCLVGHDLKYDINVLSHYDYVISAACFDTLLASYVLDNTRARYSLDSLAEDCLGIGTLNDGDVVGKGVKQIGFEQVAIETAAQYAGENAKIILQLYHHFYPLLESDEQASAIFYELETPVMKVLAMMERRGVLIDSILLKQHSCELQNTLHDLEQAAYDLVGRPFNMGSPKQLQEILFDELKLPIIEKTAKGQPSTGESVLQVLAIDYPLPQLILSHRHLSKLKSTYTDPLPEKVDSKTGRIHTSYNQSVTSTGRLSSTSPNLQNIPMRTEQGQRIREAFIAPPGSLLVAADYSQIELRIMAHFSEDETLLKAFVEGEDVHRATASEIFSVPLDEVTSLQRRHAKAVNFGLIYGMSAFGLAKQLSISRQQALDYIDIYFTRYPKVRAFIDRVRNEAKSAGFVRTLLGRKLYFPDIQSRNAIKQRAAERAAINAPMQGSSAEVIKRAMILVEQVLPNSALMLMQVHDELVFEVKEADLEHVIPLIRTQMMAAADLRVPLTVDIGYGLNWKAAH